MCNLDPLPPSYELVAFLALCWPFTPMQKNWTRIIKAFISFFFQLDVRLSCYIVLKAQSFSIPGSVGVHPEYSIAHHLLHWRVQVTNIHDTLRIHCIANIINNLLILIMLNSRNTWVNTHNKCGRNCLLNIVLYVASVYLSAVIY